MTPIAEEVAANGITALAKLVTEKLHHKYSLPFRMRRVLKKGIANHPEDTILAALQKAFSTHGALTYSTNQSLLDIANSGLLEHLIPLFGAEVDKKDALELLSYISLSRGSENLSVSYQFATDLLTCMEVAYQLYHSNAIQRKSTPGDKRRFLLSLADDAKKAGAVLSMLVTSLKDENGDWLPDQDTSPDLLSRRIHANVDPLSQYVRHTIGRLSSVDVHGSSGDVVKVPLDEIYVDIPVNFIPRQRRFINFQDLRTHLPRHEIASSWQDTIEHISKTVLLGDPGGGKSTLSKKLCYEYAKQYQEGRSALPIYVQLRTYIARVADNEQYSLIRYVLDHVDSTLIGSEVESLGASVLYYLRIGSVFVVADGLDEVLTPSNRARVVEEIKDFSQAFPLATILVTSRYVGYETNPLDGFTHLGMDYLNRSAIETIYENVTGAVLKRSKTEIQSTKGGFLTDARKKARELIRNPLLLTLIVIIYNQKNEIPDNRASLYSFCADLLFERWDGYRDITPDLPERYRLFDLFKHLSAILYEREEYGGRINKADLREEARSFFRRDYIDNREEKSAKAAHHMVEHLTGRAWILHEVGEDVFEFTHRTFLEFFYAKQLETEYEGTKELIEECLKHVEEGSRTVPAHLALQIRTKDKRAASSKVCESLTRSLEAENCSMELVDFCLDALGYLLPDGSTLSKFVAQLAPRALTMDDPSAQVKLLCTVSPLRDSILQSALPALREIKSVAAIRKVAPALYQMHWTDNKAIEVGGGRRETLHKLLISQTYPKQSTSPFLCKLAFDLDAKVNWKALRKFGFRLWAGERAHNIRQLVRDSRRMVEEVASVLPNSGRKETKYYRLAQILYTYHHEQKEDLGLGIALMRYVRYASRTRRANICLKAGALPLATEDLDLFAFSLVLFLELNGDESQTEDLAHYRDLVTDVGRALRECGSSKSSWLRSWIAGDISIVGDSRYVGRRSDIFRSGEIDVSF